MAASARPRLLLAIPHLGGGGAERVTALLAQELSRERYGLHLAVVTQTQAELAPPPPGLEVHALGALRVRTGAWELLRLVRKLKPDLILSGMAHLNFLVLMLRPLFPRKTRVLVRQNSTASAALEFGGLPSCTRAFYRLLYRRADRVICQTAAMSADLATQLRVPRARIVVLPNPVDLDAIRACVQEPCARRRWPAPDSPGPHLLAVGRLSKEKGFDLLLEALAVVRRSFAGADLILCGAGPEEASLKSLGARLGLANCIQFAGHVADPAVFFQRASAFVLSSRHEGMPNALLEAAAAGIPIVALPSSQGVIDLLRDRQGAWLAREISATALADSMGTALRAFRHGERFAHPWVEQFGLRRALAAYEELIDAVLRQKRQ